MQEKDAESGVSMRQMLDPFMELPAEKAAAMLGISAPQRLMDAEEGDTDFVPYIPHQGNRGFLLGDVLNEVAKRNGSDKTPKFPSNVMTTLEKARAVMKRRVGPKAEWHDENRHRSNEDVPSPAMRRKSRPSLPEPAVGQAVAARGPWAVGIATINPLPPAKRDMGRRAVLVSGTYTVKGATVRANIAKFSSLDDFMQHAARDDEWLFAVPPKGDGRPYDFLEALMAGDTETPWKVMTYAEYLRAMLDAAIEDEARWIGEAEQELLTQVSRRDA